MSHLLLQGDARRIPLASGSVHCCVTSPPYWSLRSYLPDSHPSKARELGSEASPDEFIENMVAVFSEVKRVLRDDGTLWLNIGDSYASNPASGGPQSALMTGGEHKRTPKSKKFVRPAGLKPKDLCMMPARLAIALQVDGWWIRQKICWCKTSPMPDPVTDRPTSATEELFLMTKSQKYYYDLDAVRVPTAKATIERDKCTRVTKGKDGPYAVQHDHETESHPLGRNMWNYWVISSESYRGAHFATFPRALVTPCIKAGTSEKGCCVACGSPWERIVDKSYIDNPGHNWSGIGDARRNPAERTDLPGSQLPVYKTLGWKPACQCDAECGPCTVFDPFIGSGTSIVVANALGRRGIGLDLSRDYLVNQAQRRISRPHAIAKRTPKITEHHPLFGDTA